jgi:hypothetical protein
VAAPALAIPSAIALAVTTAQLIQIIAATGEPVVAQSASFGAGVLLLSRADRSHD